jgi:hypothetical protein
MNKERELKRFMYGEDWHLQVEKESCFIAGFDAALNLVDIILGGCSPVDPSLHKERAQVVEEISRKVTALKQGKGVYDLDQKHTNDANVYQSSLGALVGNETFNYYAVRDAINKVG